MCAATLTVQLVPFLPKGVTFVALVAWGVQLVDALALDKFQESSLICAFQASEVSLRFLQVVLAL